MKAAELKNAVDVGYAARQDAKTASMRDEVAAISSHPYDDWTVDDYIDPTFFTGLISGKSGGKFLNFKARKQPRSH
jgi:hypothetical protein